MRSYTIHPTLTLLRLAYLRAVEANEPYEPRHGVTANHCLALGWVETVIRTSDGRVISYAELPAGEERWGALTTSEILGQRLTDEGRRMLRTADA